MKDYEVGDTITVKATVAETDKGNFTPYRVTYRDEYFWVNVKDIVKPVTPELPKRVADEMEVARESNKLGAYLNLVLNNTSTAAYQWANSDQDITDLVNAWNNGYTIKPETKLYNLLLGYYGSWVSFYKVGRFGFDIAIDKETDEYNLKHDDSYQFTQEEIDKYNEDEDSWFDNKIDLNKLKVEVKN